MRIELVVKRERSALHSGAFERVTSVGMPQPERIMYWCAFDKTGYTCFPEGISCPNWCTRHQFMIADFSSV